MLSIGVVGLPNVGKSTLFNALTKNKVAAENYPFCTIDPSVGIVSVPDERLEKLANFSHSAKTIPAAIEFVDIAGLVKGASKGEGLGNKFLANIREVDAIAQMIRIFDDSNIVHVEGNIDPLRDIEIIGLELVLADFQTVSKRLGNIEKDVKKRDKEAIKEKEVLIKVERILDEGKFANSLEFQKDEQDIIRGLNLLTTKPILYVLNKKNGGKNLDEINDQKFQDLIKYLEKNNAQWVVVDAAVEQDLNSLEDSEKEEFREALGVPKDDGVNNLIKTSYELLNLMTYFTTGADETRAWTISQNSTAPEAGAAIHGDFEEKFIRADIINWQKLIEAGSLGGAHEEGLIRTEGKEYIVQDGDVIEFRI